MVNYDSSHSCPGADWRKRGCHSAPTAPPTTTSSIQQSYTFTRGKVGEVSCPRTQRPWCSWPSGDRTADPPNIDRVSMRKKVREKKPSEKMPNSPHARERNTDTHTQTHTLTHIQGALTILNLEKVSQTYQEVSLKMMHIITINWPQPFCKCKEWWKNQQLQITFFGYTVCLHIANDVIITPTKSRQAK